MQFDKIRSFHPKATNGNEIDKGAFMGYGLTMDLQYRLEAINYVNQFIARSGNVMFPNIIKDDFISLLMERLSNPYTINQGNASLCGPAAVMFCWLCKRPDLYAQYVIKVYEKGAGEMGRLVVTPGDDCRNYDPITTPDVDWVALAALRDSENRFLDYDEETDQVSGITLPSEVEKWFKSIGFNVVENDTSLVLGEEYEVLRKAASHFMQGRSVCLFVNARLLHGGGVNLSANHWIVMTSEPTIDGKSIMSFPSENGQFDKQIDFTVYTWGDFESGSINKKRTNTVKDFLDCFYGFVAAEYNDLSTFALDVSLLTD